MKNYIKLTAAALSTIVMFSSCYEMDLYPDNQLSSSTFYKTEAHAKMAMMSVYEQMHDDNAFGLAFAWDCMGGISYGYDNPSFQKFQRGTVAANDSYITGKWASLYEGVTRANTVLQNIDNCNMSDELKAQYKAEARFMRGMYYFQLVNFYGGVPLYDETWVVANQFNDMKLPRSTAEETYKLILDDFDAALALPASWDAANSGRATRGAALAMKGKALLYNKRYQEASECFNAIIADPQYQLYGNYANLFKPGGDESSEMIFAIQNMGGVGTDIGMPMTFYLGTRAAFGSCWNNVMASTTFGDSYEWKDGRPFNWDEVFAGFTADNKVKEKVFYSTMNSAKTKVTAYTVHKQALLDMYAQRDPRMAASLLLPYTNFIGWSKNAVANHEYVLCKGMGIPANNGLVQVNGNHEAYLWRKFVAEGNMNGEINNRADTPINFPLVRLADVMLMQAECLNELGKQPEAVALINQVRARVEMPGLNSGPSYLQANTKEEVFARIRHERAVELACEGHSYFDMKRWGLLEELNNRNERNITGNKVLYTRVVDERSYLWAIPPAEIDKNDALVQNPGW